MRRRVALILALATTTASAAVDEIRLTTGFWPTPNDTVTYDNTDGLDDAGDYTLDWYTPTHLGLAYARELGVVGPGAVVVAIEGSYTRTGGSDGPNDVHIDHRTWALRLLPAYAIQLPHQVTIEAGPTVGWNHVRLHWNNSDDFVASGYGDGLEYGGRVAAFIDLASGLRLGVDLRLIGSEATVDIDFGDDNAPFVNYEHTTKTTGIAALASVGYRF